MLNEKERNALELARADIWFLLNHCDVPEIYISRCASTAEYISNTLDDKASFEPTLQRWLSEPSEFSNQKENIIKFLNRSRSRKSAK